MVTPYWRGFRVLEIRDYNTSKWGQTVQIAVDSTIYTNLMWVDANNIELRKE